MTWVNKLLANVYDFNSSLMTPVQFWNGQRPSLATRLAILRHLVLVVERPAHRHHAAALDEEQSNLLHTAAFYWPLRLSDGMVAIGRRLIQAVLEAGVALDAHDGAGRSPLHVAGWRSGLAMLLADAGADIK